MCGKIDKNNGITSNNTQIHASEAAAAVCHVPSEVRAKVLPDLLLDLSATETSTLKQQSNDRAGSGRV